MLKAAVVFFFFGLISIILGVGNVAGLSLEFGQMLLAIFLILTVISLVAGMLTGPKSPTWR